MTHRRQALVFSHHEPRGDTWMPVSSSGETVHSVASVLNLFQVDTTRAYERPRPTGKASENFAGPVDFETPRPDLPVHF